jgi:hypothetical protein
VTRRATCCCGASAIDFDGDPVFSGVCHCDNCKRRTGSAFGWSVYFSEGQLLAEPADMRAYAFDGASGPQDRRFCPTCGSTLYWRSAVFANLVGVAGGCLLEPPPGRPTVSATDSRRCAWVDLPGEVTRMA